MIDLNKLEPIDVWDPNMEAFLRFLLEIFTNLSVCYNLRNIEEFVVTYIYIWRMQTVEIRF